MKLIQLISLLVGFLTLSSTLYAQNSSLYFTAGKSISFAYEGIFTDERKENGDVTKLGFRVSGGKVYQICFFCDDEPLDRKYLATSFVILAGNGTSFLDLSFGGGLGWRKRSKDPVENYFAPVVNIGYRYVEDSVVLRIGAGVPEILYLSVGLAF